ncbi:uncharacterized protein JCM15063_000882 [Sporobolomyces koalae]|uniref:uncharacterized protein n=1 Tax=Sporobolomyces koalae TaxID=500713 RepID=UPI00317A9501
MYSTQYPQQTYPHYNPTAASHNFDTPADEAKWSLEDPRFVTTDDDQFWRVDEPLHCRAPSYDGNYVLQSLVSEIDPGQRIVPQYTTSVQGTSQSNSDPYNATSHPTFDSAPFVGHVFGNFDTAIQQYPQSYMPQQSTHPDRSLCRLEPESAVFQAYATNPYPTPATSTHALSFAAETDLRLLQRTQDDPTLCARYEPSSENLPAASRPPSQARGPLRHPSSDALLDGAKTSYSSSSRSTPSSSNASPPLRPPLSATPRRLRSNLSISIERAVSSESRSPNHSPASSASLSLPASPFRSLPSPLSPVGKRPFSQGPVATESELPAASLHGYSESMPSAGARYLQHFYDSGSGMNDNIYGVPYLEQGYEIESAVGNLHLASRPASTNSIAYQYVPIVERQNGFEDEWTRVRDQQVRDYIRATDKLQAGEKTVLILNPRIAQRSYGTERRLLNPPPMAYILGSSWHTGPSSQMGNQSLSAPEVQVSIYPPRSADKEAMSSKESHATAIWMGSDGQTLVNPEDPDAVPISGRFVSKSLAVSLEGDLNKDTISDVRTVVTVVDKSTQVTIGKFLGKPMTVISKPSKKKQILAGGTAGLNHGSLVALYNRAKAGSGSTRYLATSGPQTNFPSTDWKHMTSNAPQPYAPNDTADVRFISKTQSWDPFLIYTVDLSISSAGEAAIQLPAPQHGYPKPPLNANPVDLRKAQALYYNQPVVLQCLATGVVSPVLILRKIESKTTAVGGGSLEPTLPNFAETAHLAVAPGEKLGEPVSQYKNVAFEVYQATPDLRSQNPFDRRLPKSSFLACMNDEIGIHVAEEEKTICKSASPAVPPHLDLPPPTLANSLYSSTSSYASNQLGFESISEGSSDDSESNRKRARTSTSIGFAPPFLSPPSPASSRPASRHKRRGQSLSSLATLQQSRSPSPRHVTELVWTVPCGDSGVWSILAIDLARHSFFVPEAAHRGSNGGVMSRAPANPVGPNLPIATRCDAAPRGGTGDFESSCAVLHGDNFDASHSIWVGDQPCVEQVVQSSKTMLFRPPASPLSYSNPLAPRRICIVRFDGVVFPTNVYYRD